VDGPAVGRGVRPGWYGANGDAARGGRGFKAPQCASRWEGALPREDAGLDAEGRGATRWARARRAPALQSARALIWPELRQSTPV
jgi:hypothetical protein